MMIQDCDFRKKFLGITPCCSDDDEVYRMILFCFDVGFCPPSVASFLLFASRMHMFTVTVTVTGYVIGARNVNVC